MSYPKLTPIIAKGAIEPRYLEDRFADIVNVKDFGAKGDGETDDTNAFQAAAAVSSSIFCPDGEYVVNGQTGRATAFGAFFSVNGNHDLHIEHIQDSRGKDHASTAVFALLDQVKYTLGDSAGTIGLLPTKLQPHGVLIKYGVSTGNGRKEFDYPFPVACFGVVGSISPDEEAAATQLSFFRSSDVDKAGFTANARYYNPSNGNTGESVQPYFWIALGY